jgi:Domain of unknown function (DUF4189)/PAN domain
MRPLENQNLKNIRGRTTSVGCLTILVGYLTFATDILCFASEIGENGSGVVSTFDNYALTGPEYRSVRADDAAQCVAACTSDPQCGASDINKWSGECSLKHDGASFRFDPRFISATVRPSGSMPLAEQPMELRCLTNANFDGVVLSVGSTEASDLCSTRCETQEDCVAFTYSPAEKACTLFRSVRAEVDADKVLAGYKLQVTKGSEPATVHCFAPPAPPPAPAEPVQSQSEPAAAPVYSAVVAVGKLGRTRVHWEALWNIDDLEASKSEALQRCSRTASQCQVAWTSGTKCIGLAYVRDGWSVQIGSTKSEAQIQALQECQRVNRTKCSIGGGWCNSATGQQ